MKDKYVSIGVAISMSLTLLLLAKLAFGKPAKEPLIVSDIRGSERCLPDDPAFPCPGRLITVYNPTKRWVKVIVTCGPELLLDLSNDVAPKHRVTFDLGASIPGGLSKGQCSIRKWAIR